MTDPLLASGAKTDATAPNGEVIPPQEELESSFSLFDYLSTDKGHEIAKNLLDLWKTLQNATIVGSSDEKKEVLKRQHESWKLGMILQSILSAVVILSAVILAWQGKMESTVAGFLGVALGYVLGKKT
jgi:hypothetical protein